MTLFYVPLESYKERYTSQLSAPVTGWLERNWVKAGIKYKRINGFQLPGRQIKTGVALDAVGRSWFSFEQIKNLLLMAEQGEITSDDVIYFDDFWTPGFEALPYTFHLLGIKPKMYANLWAQSVDEFDFTHPMRHWMRPTETGIANALDGIFVADKSLQDLVVFGGIVPREKVHAVGHPFCSEEVLERCPDWYRSFIREDGKSYLDHARMNQVVFSSRFDKEKNPHFLMDVIQASNLTGLKFIICTGAKKLRSNDPTALERLHHLIRYFPDNIILRENLTKEEYYSILCESKVQFNCSSQDFISYVLLDASVCGCYPIYPYFRSFPQVLRQQHRFLYNHLDVQDAVHRIDGIIRKSLIPHWSVKAIKERSWIHSRFNHSWIRMLDIMQIPRPATKLNESYSDNPYDLICY